MKREPHSKYTFAITDCKLLVTWNDGKIEDLSPTLPDYLREEIERYLDEMDDLRTERPKEYLIVNDKGGNKMKVTREQLVAWLGSDVTMDKLVSMLLEIANGEYKPDALQKDVWCYQGEAE